MLRLIIPALAFLLPSIAVAQIEVHFNLPVDTTLALSGNAAPGEVDFIEIVLEEIAKAQHSIDVAVYNLNLRAIVDGLTEAHQRGVKVRVIGHVENVSDPDSRFDELATGIPVATNQLAPQGERQSLMHHKFFAIDARPGAPENAEPTVITGSWNPTFYQTYADANNLVVIRDSAVAGAYLREFEEMWGSSEETPNAAEARFGRAKRNNTDHLFTLIDGTTIEIRFSPSDSSSARIADALATAETSIYTANLTFTYDDLSKAIRDRVTAFGIDARILIDNVDDPGSEFGFIGGFAEAYDWMKEGQLHHKYAIVDAIPIGAGSDPVVITGSHNWTAAAERENDENLLLIHSAPIANLFLQEFAARYREAGGTRPFRRSSTDAPEQTEEMRSAIFVDLEARMIRLTVPNVIDTMTATLFDALGRPVCVASAPTSGHVTIPVRDLPTGWYIVRLSSGHGAHSIPLLLPR